ncbi:MAG: efflux RND transporter periplasmic adaptor subunit [Betaproteobacteria bacterium]|nr:efflux RND transporter periplasmic adaptor subunit [Betaproteobacteria bacterium]
MKRPAVSRKVVLIALGVVLVGTFGFIMARTGPLAATRVTVVQVEEGSVTPALFGIGTVEARRAWLIGPTTAGRVKSVQVDVGGAVAAGEVLAEMDPVDLDERAAALEAGMARAHHAIAAAEAQRQDALARHEVAALNARRYQDLGRDRFVATSAVELKVQEQTSARAALAAADSNLAAARQDLLRLQADREGLRQQRRQARLLAPAAGVVSARDAEPGSTVVAGQAVLRLVDPASLWVRVRFDQGRSAGLKPGLPAQIVLRSRPGQPLPGRVARVELLADAVTEERIAQVAFDAIPEDLSVGELAEVTLQLPTGDRGPVLPNAALRRQGDATGVWVAAHDGLRFVPVRTAAASLDGLVRVADGLRPGDRVVVHAERELAAGSRIRVVDSLAERGK